MTVPPTATFRTRSRLPKGGRSAIAYGVLALLLALLAIASGTGVTTIRLTSGSEMLALPDLALPIRVTAWLATAAVAVIAISAFWLARTGRALRPGVRVIAIVCATIGFLVWAADGGTIPRGGLLAGSLSLAVPLIFGSLAGVVSERSGVVNVAIEGQLLAGAFSSAVLASLTGSAVPGLIAAAVAGVLVSTVLAVFSIRYLVDQVIVGIVLNVLVSGLTGFLFTQLLAPNPQVNSPGRLERIAIPGLSEIPVLGPVLFRQTVIVYLMYIGVAIAAYGLFRTRWGLRLRAVGEQPQAAETAGISVSRTRMLNVALAGMIAGLGGAYFTLGNVGAFNKEMTAGAGFIALAAVIFGRWNPIRAALAGLLFGFVANLQNTFSVIGSPVPSEFLLMAPYLVTIIAVAGLVGGVRPPAAAGKNFRKE